MAIGELEYDHEDFSKERAGDEKLALRFFRKAKQNSEKTAVAGRPIFEEEDYIQIMIPGDRTSTIVRPVSPIDKARFGKQYEHWQRTQQEEMLQGTPLDAWGIMNLAQIEEYRYFGIRTIEQLASLRDDICQKIMGATALKQRAESFLQMAKDAAPMQAMQLELKKRDDTISGLQTQMEEMGKIIKKMEAGSNVKAATK